MPLNEPFSVRVWVLERGSFASGIRLRVDAAMPEHQHGMNHEPSVMVQSDGSFLATGLLFHMPGRWELYCDVEKDGVTERTQFEVTLE